MPEADPPGKTALLTAAEVVKYLTALGTGAIVFSAGLLSDKLFLSPTAKWFLFISWFVLALSVLAGLVSGMRIPVQLKEENYNLEDKFLKYPGLVQQGAFFLGIVFLGIALTAILIDHGRNPSASEPNTKTEKPASPTPQTIKIDRRFRLNTLALGSLSQVDII